MSKLKIIQKDLCLSEKVFREMPVQRQAVQVLPKSLGHHHRLDIINDILYVICSQYRCTLYLFLLVN